MRIESHDASDDLRLAESVRWAVSRLSSRLRAEHPGGDRPLTRLAASVLANLAHAGPLTASKLAAIEGLQVQSLTRVLNELDELGRIRRSRSRVDARQQDIVITDAGRNALSEHVRDGNAWLAAALRECLTDAERGILEIAAGLLRVVAESTAAGATPPPPRDDGAAPPL
ncbi:MarR family winged helix-turn-helix transcriptional regulator [Nocardia otitidiscaviarum]|uniref:MarR family winged helix-turn-helix transcriptional regulator n=1 Tax=Nocardia otitidiscaviarum TaxID=1823 RepID=UPI001894737D|nr:MarR family transcriptional regulator [Nocardia otitidiscaviarum]MBF6179306.1 MarR family transcriptional regulator [Nocardia otitidiscaviarum]